MMGRVPAVRDKRQGSIIHDTLSPVAAELAQTAILNSIFREQSFLLTATGINLDNWAANFTMERRAATNAIRIAEMIDTGGNPIDLPIGSRFSTPNVAGGVNFALTAYLDEPGRCLLTAEVPGSSGNAYLGALLPLFVINNLGSATMIGTYIPAEDTETDDQLRERIIDRVNQKSYGGNVADYKEFTTAIDGVGDVKVFPIWDGGGTVKLSILDSKFNVATPDFIAVVQEIIDPIPHSGEGLGIAPIGHRVTVTTPEEYDINVSANVSLRSGFTIPQLQPLIEEAIGAYILDLRKEWDSADVLNIFVARINSAIISVNGVDNVTNIEINGFPGDLQIEQTAELQQLPMLGEVLLTSA